MIVGTVVIVVMTSKEGFRGVWLAVAVMEAPDVAADNGGGAREEKKWVSGTATIIYWSFWLFINRRKGDQNL